MPTDVGNVEELSFSNGVRVTRERLAYCPMHGMDGNDGRCHPTEYVLYGFHKDEILARLVRCHRDGFGAPEEIVPVHKAGSVIVNHDPATRDRYHGRLDRAAGHAMSMHLHGDHTTAVQADSITGDIIL